MSRPLRLFRTRRSRASKLLIPSLVGALLLGATSRCDTAGAVYGLTDDAVFVVPVLPCVGPLPCPEGGDLGGTFRLIELPPSLRHVRAFRVESVFWLARNSVGRDLPITGSGAYTVDERGTPSQRLLLDLEVAGIPRRYDSGQVPIGAPFPRIDIEVIADDPTGFGDTIQVRGVPFPPERPEGTPCGLALTCDPDTEICVRTQGGLGSTYACEPVPAGCEEDRTCGCAGDAICGESPLIDCEDEGGNTLACICLACV